jgi:hypothetical protein
MRKSLCTAAVLGLLLATSVYAGSGHDHGTDAKQASAPTAEQKAMMAEMMNCSICKPMASKMDVLGPAMTTEVVKLTDGMMIMHEVTDPKMMSTFRTAIAETHKAGEASMAFTPEQAKTQLCSWCQQVHSVMAEGAHFSSGDTKNGSLIILSSTDPAVQTKIAALQAKCMEMGM